MCVHECDLSLDIFMHINFFYLIAHSVYVKLVVQTKPVNQLRMRLFRFTDAKNSLEICIFIQLWENHL